MPRSENAKEVQRHLDEQSAEQARKDRKRVLLLAIAEFLSSDLARKSIELEMGKPMAKEWAKIRDASSVRGYVSFAETVAALERDLA